MLTLCLNEKKEMQDLKGSSPIYKHASTELRSSRCLEGNIDNESLIKTKTTTNDKRLAQQVKSEVTTFIISTNILIRLLRSLL